MVQLKRIVIHQSDAGVTDPWETSYNVTGRTSTRKLQ